MKTNSLDFDAQALREKILDLAMRGKLVKQDPNDEPASVLLEKIKAEKAELVKEGKIKKSKALPEITDEEKPFDIPDSWKWVRLGEIGNYIQRGRSPKYDKESLDHPIISQKCVQWNSINIEDAKHITEDFFKKLEPYRFIQKNDILWNSTGTGTVGRLNIVKDNYSHVPVDSHVTLMRMNQFIDSDYIYYFLRSPQIQKNLGDYLTGTTKQKELGLTNILKINIPLPPVSEQSRIAAKIAQLFALLRKVESSTQQYAKLQTLLKSKVLDLAMRGKLVEQDQNDEPASVLLEKEGLKESNEIPHQIPNSWSWIVLGSGAKFINGRAYKKSELLNDSSLTPILRVGNLFTNSSYYYSDLKLNPDKYIDNGDLIYAWSASFGPQIWTGGHVIYHYHIWKVIPKQIIEKQFLYYFLLDKRNVIGETDLHGSTMKHITKTNMEHLSFPLPPLSEQKRIVKKINFLLEIL